LPDGFRDPRVCLPGIVAIEAPPFARGDANAEPSVERFCAAIDVEHPLNAFPLVVLVDDSGFTNHALNNFLWTTFTRSNPAADVHGIGAFVREKHWGCRGPLIIDARLKPHHAPPLIEDPDVSKSVDQLAARGGPLHGII
jgi:4-hydroxy-3-polyprenylbenzoate decarboxylase